MCVSAWPGHDAALLQMHRLQGELEALHSLRAEEAQDDLLGLPAQEQGVAPQVGPSGSTTREGC